MLEKSWNSIREIATFQTLMYVCLPSFSDCYSFPFLSGRRWIKQMFIGAFLIPAMVCGTAFFINFIAIYYHASRAIPFGTMVAVCCICFFVILPLNLVGTILGRNLSGQPNFPCRVNAVPRPIPEKKWFMEPAVIVCLGGILPFGSIFIEM